MNDSQQPDENLTTLLRVPSEIEAAPIVAALESAGIKSFVTGGFTAGFIAEAPGDVQIRIRSADLPVAKQALADFRSDNTKIDWNQIDIGRKE